MIPSAEGRDARPPSASAPSGLRVADRVGGLFVSLHAETSDADRHPRSDPPLASGDRDLVLSCVDPREVGQQDARAPLAIRDLDAEDREAHQHHEQSAEEDHQTEHDEVGGLRRREFVAESERSRADLLVTEGVLARSEVDDLQARIVERLTKVLALASSDELERVDATYIEARMLSNGHVEAFGNGEEPELSEPLAENARVKAIAKKIRKSTDEDGKPV